MQLLELTLANFKRFAEGRFDISPGLTLFWGPNESGKSTVHEGICCALFGRERGKAIESWAGGNCLVTLSYRTNGKTYRLERRLTEVVSRLGVLNGDELADAVTDKDQIESLLADHLGITSRHVFENTVSVRQTNLSRPGTADLEAVGGEIQRVLTGKANVSAAEILKKLETRKTAIKGKSRRPANPREYDKITDRLRKLAEELADARASRTLINNLGDEFSDLQLRSERDTERLGTLEGLLARHGRWYELKKRESEKDKRHQNVFSTLKKIKDAFSSLESTHKELEGYADLIGKDDEIADHLSKTSSRRTELESRLSEMDAAGGKPSEKPSRSMVTAILIGASVFALAGLALGYLVNHLLYALLAPALALIIKYIALTAGNGSGKKHLTDLIDAAHDELRQVEAEEQSILSYINCRDADEAWWRIKSYRNLSPKSRELEATLDALLGGRNMEDWDTEETELSRELTNIRRQLEEEFKGYEPTTQETESWKSEFASLQNTLPNTQARLHEVRGSLEAEKRNARDLAALEGEIEYLHGRKAELEFTFRAYQEAINALSTVTQTVSEEYLPSLSQYATDYMKNITSGRYTAVSVSSDWDATVDCVDRSGVSPAVLSIGALDQLYFSLRIACGEVLSAGRKLPVILDDPFTAFDRNRLDNALDLLAKLAKENQIILLTHDPYVLDWARARASEGKVASLIHELPVSPG